MGCVGDVGCVGFYKSVGFFFDFLKLAFGEAFAWVVWLLCESRGFFCVGFLRGSVVFGVGFSFSFIKKVVKKGLDNKFYTRFILL